MNSHDQDPPSQRQDSRQSESQGGQQKSSGKPAQDQPQGDTGIGSSQGQDRGSPSEQQEPRPSAGTADIERGSARDRGQSASNDSIVNDPTGAFKERP